MKLKACLFVLVVAGKSSSNKNPKNPEAKRWGDDPVNDDACIYTEKNGITRVTTMPGLGEKTKCYKLFQCDDGAKVQARLNEFGLGTRQKDCQENVVKFSYSIPRDDFMDFYHWEDWFCDEHLERGWELGEWTTLEDVVRFSFEFTHALTIDYYDWLYDYHQFMYDYYGEGSPLEEISKFDIQFKCSDSSVPLQMSEFPEPETTTTAAATTTTTTTTPGPTTTTINENYNTIDKERFLIKLM